MQMSESKLSMAEQIEQRAYELYLERGRADGQDLADWLAAEKELTELSKIPLPSAPRGRAAAADQRATATA
jgi:hypothetical protein